MTESRKGGDPQVAAQLREVRLSAGLSQHAMAARLGITPGHVSRIESAQRSPSIELVHRWYRECGYELDAVSVGTAEQAQSLALAVAALPEGELDTVIRVVRVWPYLTERARGVVIGLVEAAEPNSPPG